MKNKRAIVKIIILVAFGIYAYFHAKYQMRDRINQRAAAENTVVRGASSPAAAVREQAAQPALPAPQPGTIIHTGTPRPAGKMVYDRTIIKVSDGDTLVLDGREKVRLLGVDTPEKNESDKLTKQAKRLGVNPQEIVRLGEKSSAFTLQHCKGKKCCLVLDERKKDDYGRTLAYVYIEGGFFLNEELIKQGYATVYKFFNYSKKGYFLALERQAKHEKRGLWAEPLFVKISE